MAAMITNLVSLLGELLDDTKYTFRKSIAKFFFKEVNYKVFAPLLLKVDERQEKTNALPKNRF
jgi:hypothetical protein